MSLHNKGAIKASFQNAPFRVSQTFDGRSPDLRVFAQLPFPAFASGHYSFALRLQLRGQSRIWRLMATPDRVPFSSR